MPAPVSIAKANRKPPWEDYDAVLRTAERSRAIGDLARAHTFYARLVELDPKDTRGWVGMANTAQSLDERIISWGYALAITPDSWEARLQLDAAVDERIAACGISDAHVLIALGRTLAEIGQRASAHRLLSRATDLDPTNAEGWLWRGGVSDDTNEVISCLQQALTLEPNNERAKAGLAWALEKQTKTQPAVTAADLQSAKATIEAGHAALQTGDLAAAHQAFQRATELNPLDDQAWFWRGSTAPNIDQALSYIEQALKLNPQHSAAKETRWWLRAQKFREKFPGVKPRPSPLVIPLSNPPEFETTNNSRKNSLDWRWLVAVLALVATSTGIIWLILFR